MERVLFANFAILHEFKAHLGELLLVLVPMMRNALAFSTLKLDEIVLGHILI